MSPTKLADKLLPDDLFSKSLATKAVALGATVAATDTAMATRARRRSQLAAGSHAPFYQSNHNPLAGLPVPAGQIIQPLNWYAMSAMNYLQPAKQAQRAGCRLPADGQPLSHLHKAPGGRSG